MAKKFKFKLDSFLTIKKFNVTKAENALNEVLKIKYEKEQEIVNIKFEIEGMNNDKGRLGIIDLQSRFHRKVFLEERVEQVKNEILKIEEIEQVRRAELAEKMKEQKIIEKLKEKKLEEYKLEMNKEEGLNLDEISITEFVKKEKVY